jgi:K319-like protein
MNLLAIITASLLMLGTIFTFNISSVFAQFIPLQPPTLQPSHPCENNGHAVLGSSKQIFKQSNHCVIIENNNVPATICPPGSTLQNVVCVPFTNPGQTPPVANAGASQTATSGTTVFLDGSGSFATTSGATIVSYSWIQSSGVTVTLNGANTATPSFVAPTVVNQTSLVFNLTVTDSLGQVSTPSSVTVTVFPS